MTPKKIAVIGGGSSGWMAAAYLNAALNRNGKTVAEISLVESPDVPRIGVGEATVPSINHILSVIGISEGDFLKRVDGTFKQAITRDHCRDVAIVRHFDIGDMVDVVPDPASGRYVAQ